MSEIDDFASALLDEAKRFLERSIEARGAAGETPNLHAALMLALCAFEAHLNAVCDEMAKRTKSPHDLTILLEREVRLKDGEYKLENKLKIFRLEDRLDFLYKRFGLTSSPTGNWRSRLSEAILLRNNLTHPKSIPTITIPAVQAALSAVIEAIDALYLAIYRKPFPLLPMGLQSSMEF